MVTLPINILTFWSSKPATSLSWTLARISGRLGCEVCRNMGKITLIFGIFWKSDFLTHFGRSHGWKILSRSHENTVWPLIENERMEWLKGFAAGLCKMSPCLISIIFNWGKFTHWYMAKRHLHIFTDMNNAAGACNNKSKNTSSIRALKHKSPGKFCVAFWGE